MWLVALLWLAGAPAWAGDKDDDGISNKEDACKEEPEDVDGFEDDDGCPDPDNDGDGKPDTDDKCPDEAEDSDGFEDDDGCPDPDNDGDGVLDGADQCADESEDSDDGDGCPTVTWDLVSTKGYMPALKQLTADLGAASAKAREGCDDASGAAKKWLGSHDAAKMEAVFEARLARAPEHFDPQGPRDIVAAQGTIYKSLKISLGIYCEEHKGWQGVSSKVDAVYASWLVEEEAPKDGGK